MNIIQHDFFDYGVPVKKYDQYFDKISAAHEKIMQHAKKHHINQPLIFAGVAVFLLCKPEHFRPESNKTSGDIDYIIPQEDIQIWEEITGKKFQYFTQDKKNGASLTFIENEMEIELLADPVFEFGLEVIFKFPLSYKKLQQSTTIKKQHEFKCVQPIQLLLFKLLAGRGLEKGKYDFNDATALIHDTKISAHMLWDAVFEHNEINEDRIEFIIYRLHQCTIDDEKMQLVAFVTAFKNLAAAWYEHHGKLDL